MISQGTIIIIVLFVALFVVFCYASRKRENYGPVTGALGRFYKGYTQCLDQCAKEDPGKYLGKTKGSLYCSMFCDSKYTDLARQGGPSYPDTEPVNHLYQPNSEMTYVDQCYDQCGSGRDGRECRDKCSCYKEVNEKCQQDCAYSKLDAKDCMRECFKVNEVNCATTSWLFK